MVRKRDKIKIIRYALRMSDTKTQIRNKYEKNRKYIKGLRISEKAKKKSDKKVLKEEKRKKEKQ